MKLSELANYCKSIDINCSECDRKEACKRFAWELEEISPVGVLELVEEDKEI